MKRRSHAQWRALFQAQQVSGLSAAAFCRGQQVCPKYFSLRRRQLMNRAELGAPKTASAFVPVVVPRPSEAPALEVRWGEALHVRVPVSVAPHWLAELLHALRT